MCSTSQWSYQRARTELSAINWKEECDKVLYRPFDDRWTVLNRNVVTIPRKRIMNQLCKSNLAICIGRQGQATGNDPWNLIFCTSKPEDYNLFARGNNICLPRDFHPDAGQNKDIGFLDLENGEVPNINAEIIQSWTDLGLCSGPNKKKGEQIFNYIYGFLHSHEYRLRYGAFLAMEFPRIFRPRKRELFEKIGHFGELLLSIHMMKFKDLDPSLKLIGSDNFKIEKVSYSQDTIWINAEKTKGFGNVTEEVWRFKIGGYQVCEKWLKDRQEKNGRKPRIGRTLEKNDLRHYQKIITGIGQTIYIMRQIDDLINDFEGWPRAFATKDS